MRHKRAVAYWYMLFVLLAIASPPREATAQSGDPIVDSYLTSYYTNRVGSTAPPTNLILSNYGDHPNNYLKCDVIATPSAPPWEVNCPSDLTYTPNAHTGGYQAFGVGLKNIYATSYWDYYCTLEEQWVWDPELGEYVLEYVYVCYYELVQVPAEVTAIAVARIKWGSNSYVFNDFTGLTLKLSNLAFMGGPEPPVENCDPENIIFGADAHCTYPGTYVSEAGYEDKIIVPDSCSLSSRTGTWSDFYNGCFHSAGGYTDLPSAYVDTNAADPGTGPFVLSVGTARARDLVTGTTYTWRLYFGQGGNEPVTGSQVLRHTGSVTVKQPFHVFCNLYASVFGENAACFFSVDQTNLTPAVPW